MHTSLPKRDGIIVSTCLNPSLSVSTFTSRIFRKGHWATLRLACKSKGSSASPSYSWDTSSQNLPIMQCKPNLHGEDTWKCSSWKSWLSFQLMASSNCQVLDVNSNQTSRQLQPWPPFNYNQWEPPSWAQSQLWEMLISCCFKSLWLGVVCYAATDNQKLLKDLEKKKIPEAMILMPRSEFKFF